MSNPVKGPTAGRRQRNVDAPGSYYDYFVRYKQKKPYNLALPYRRNGVVVTSATKFNIGTYLGYANACLSRSDWQMGCPISPLYSEFASETTLATNAAYDKFVNELGEAALWSVNLAERKQAIDMMTRRFGQLYRFCILLRRREYYLAAKELEAAIKGPKSYERLKSKSFADSFLEFHFGWEPLVKDIYATVDILQRPVPFGSVRGRGKKIAINATYNNVTNGPYGKETRIGHCKGFVQAQCGARVWVNNPNLWLANQLGLVNPATVAWELIPYSFVVDWFINVGSVLRQHSDLYGIVLDAPWTTIRSKVTSDAYYRFDPKPSGLYNEVRTTMSGSYTERKQGVPVVQLAVNRITRLSVTRALTAISLLIQKGLK